jgi:hypothetical protein
MTINTPSVKHDEFQQGAKRWLSTYKREVLGVEENGVWVQNGQRYPHILPQEKYELNILASVRDEFWDWLPSQQIQLQRDFHHLNSSQALCFNLFFPILRENGQALEALLSAMGIAGVPMAGASFEFQPDKAEGTCIDFSLPLRSGPRINFEIKYTESEFGSAKADPAHLEKFESIYKPRMAGRFQESFCSSGQFLEHYQIARNVWHLNEATGDIAVFLLSKANTRLRQQEPIIKECALEPFRSRIRIIYLEDLVVDLSKTLKPDEMVQRQQLEEFRAKYLPFVKLQPGPDRRGKGPARIKLDIDAAASVEVEAPQRIFDMIGLFQGEEKDPSDARPQLRRRARSRRQGRYGQKPDTSL